MLTQNISTLNTSYDSLSRNAGRDLMQDHYVTQLLQIIESAIEARNHKDLLLHQLVRFETLIRFEIPLAVRPELFRKLNNLLSHISLTCTNDHTLCAVFLNLITLVKNQIDKQEQNLAESNEKEWDELQRSVFLLANWDDAIQNKT